MNDKITFISMNCNGLNDPAKRRDVLNFLKSKRFSIFSYRRHISPKKKKIILEVNGVLNVTIIAFLVSRKVLQF